jgi:RNA polymerase sigma-70 factor (ECF subfamily)
LGCLVLLDVTDQPTPPDQLADAWRQHRPYVLDLAFRMMGGIGEAEDIVQEAFARLLRADLDDIEDVRGWLVVVVSRLCLDHFRSAGARHQQHAVPLDAGSSVELPGDAPDPADRVTLDDRVGLALLVVLERLSPAERTVFVLHDVFQFSFDDVAPIVGRTPAACRQLASRARRRIQDETGPGRFDVDQAMQHLVAERFIAACAGGDLESLMHLLDERVAGYVDLGHGLPARPRFVGRVPIATNILRMFGPDSNRTLVSLPANGEPGVLVFEDRRLMAVILLKTEAGLIDHIHAIADPTKLASVASLLAD